MKRFVLYTLFLVLLSSISFNGYYFLSQKQKMTVISVHDGDTFTLGDGQRVRLLGVNAPELGRCLSDAARARLNELVLNKTIRLTEEKRDTYGRRMGLVYIGDTLVNEVMLKEGYARPDYTPNSQSEHLKDAFHSATENKKGIFGTCKKVNPTPPSPECVVKGNIEGSSGEKFYYLPTCRHYNQIVLDEDIGEQFFCSQKEASAAGFQLAPDCLR